MISCPKCGGTDVLSLPIAWDSLTTVGISRSTTTGISLSSTSASLNASVGHGTTESWSKLRDRWPSPPATRSDFGFVGGLLALSLILTPFSDHSIGMKILWCLLSFIALIYTAREWERWQVQNIQARTSWESKWVCRRCAHVWTPEQLMSETD